MRKMAQKMIAIAVAMVIVLGMASVTQMDTLAASYSFEGEAHDPDRTAISSDLADMGF